MNPADARELADFLDQIAETYTDEQADKVRDWAKAVRTQVPHGKLYYLWTYYRDSNNYDATDSQLDDCGVFTSREAAKAHVYEEYERRLKTHQFSTTPKRPVFFEDREPSLGQSRAWPQDGDYGIEEIDMINGEQV